VDLAPDRINAAALLLARGTPAQPALVCCGHTLHYGELRKAVARAATTWQECGLAPGEVVMLRGDHGVEHVIAFLGAVWAGGVPVPLRAAACDEQDVAPRPVRYRIGSASAAAQPAWSEWPHDFRGAPPSAAMPRELLAPACWTEPRGGASRVLPHRFALTLMARPGTLPLARAGSMLAVLRALRRGVTAVLYPRLAGFALEPST